MEAVRQVALSGEGYARMLAGWFLVDQEEVPLAERAEYAWRYALFLEGVRAFEPGWEAREAWRRAAPLLEAVQDPRAFSAWQRLLPEPEAVAALRRLREGERLWEALFRGQAYGALLEALPPGARPDLRAQALYRLGWYREALPFYQAWAGEDPRGYLGLGYALWRLGRREEALAALARYPHPESRYAQGRLLEEMGRVLEAVAAYRGSTPEGLWRATALLERQGLKREALDLYLELAQGESPYADDAALRAYLLAGDLGLEAKRVEAWVRLQDEMASYHLHLRVTDASGRPIHPYLSQAWTWPFLVRPVLYFARYPGEGIRQVIYANGNPAIFWGAVLAVPLTAYRWWRDRDWRAGFVAVCALGLYAPWLLVSRPQFLFYATPISPFLVLACVFSLRWLSELRIAGSRSRPYLPFVVGYVVLSVGLFIWFWPVLTGGVPSDEAFRLRAWFPGWT